MSITDELQLPADVIVTPVDALPDDVRGQLQNDSGDVVLTRQRARITSRIVDARAAVLLEQFREPTTVARAVIAAAAPLRADPHELLVEAYPLIKRMLGDGILVPATAADAAEITPRLGPSDTMGDLTIVRSVHVVDDTEVHEATWGDQRVAVKVVRADGPAQPALVREAAVLERLDGEVAPRLLLGPTTVGDHTYLAMEWIDGQPILHEAARLRLGGASGRQQLARLAERTVAAYARLHDLGVVHGDVHPNNVLVDDRHDVRLVDFGFAGTDEVDQPERAGVAFFFEPELAAAYLDRRPLPSTTPASEQYALAALVWLCLTGAHTRYFSLDKESMLAQVVNDEPVAFAQLGVVGWTAVEHTLRRALAREPVARYASLRAFADAFNSAAAADVRADPPDDTEDEDMTGRLLAQLGHGAPDALAARLPAPTASANYGAAGIAFGLLRLAQARQDPALFSLARAWSARADAARGDAEAFSSPALDITPQTVGEVSPYHTASGVFLVNAMMAAAAGDVERCQHAVDAFVDHSRPVRDPDPDLALGSSGTLVAGAMLRALPLAPHLDLGGVQTLCDRLAGQIWARLADQPPLGELQERAHLGAAHGWAGYIYAQLRWFAHADSLPDGLVDRLDQIAELAAVHGGGVRWPWYVGNAEEMFMPGWCNGTAGHVIVLLAAHAVTGDDRYLGLARQAGRDVLLGPSNVANLCCGHAGRAYALLALYRTTRDGAWLSAARRLAAAATRTSLPAETASLGLASHSLYKGTLGLAVLLADLERPDLAAMPLFEPEPAA